MASDLIISHFVQLILLPADDSMSSSTRVQVTTITAVYNKVVKYLLEKYNSDEVTFHFVAAGFGGKFLTRSSRYHFLLGETASTTEVGLNFVANKMKVSHLNGTIMFIIQHTVSSGQMHRFDYCHRCN